MIDNERQRVYSDEYYIDLIAREIASGRLLTPQLVNAVQNSTQVYAGGTNRCPNSDFSYSEEAWTVAATPGDSSNPNNSLLHAVYSQKVGENIGSLVSATEAEEFKPVWNKAQGAVEFGTTTAGENRDIAIRLSDNPLKPQDIWHLRAALSTRAAASLPDGSVFYMGFWTVKNDLTQGWIEGENVTIGVKKFYTPSNNTIEYFLMGKLDTGFQVKSNVLTITDAPPELNEQNIIQLSFTGTAGFTEVNLYRKRGGVTHQIARITNSAQLQHDDKGDFMFPVPDFPVLNQTALRAYGEVFPYVLSIDILKSFSDFRIRIPNFDTTKVKATYIRFGLKNLAGEQRQLFADTIWCGSSYNVWSPSPLDNPLFNPSSSRQTSGTPTTPTGSTPPNRSGTCVIEDTDLLLSGNEFTKFSNQKLEGLKVDGGWDVKSNEVGSVIRSEVTEIYKVEFNCGLAILCTESHRFIRSFEDGTGIAAKHLRWGDIVQGKDVSNDEYIRLRVVSVGSHYMPESKVVALKIKQQGNYTPYYAGGSRELGIVAFFHNLKATPVPIEPLD